MMDKIRLAKDEPKALAYLSRHGVDECLDRGFLVACPDGARDGKEVSACVDQWAAIFGCDPADRDRGNFDHLIPPFEQFSLGPMLGVLGATGEERAECDIIRACLARFQREMA